MAYRTIEIQLVPETFGLLLFGLVGMMKAKPDITDDELATLIAQTLRDERDGPAALARAPRRSGRSGLATGFLHTALRHSENICIIVIISCAMQIQGK